MIVQLRSRLQTDEDSLQGAAARAALQMAPWELHADLSQIHEQDLDPGLRPLKQRMDAWAAQLSDAADERRMESWLPSISAQRSQDGNHDDRKAALEQVPLLPRHP